jgi:MFS family permease
MREKILGLRRNVFFLGIVSLFNDFSSEMVLSVLPAFFISVLKTGAASLGIVEGVADAASNVIKIFSGRLSDKIERRKIFAVVGYGISVCSRPFYLAVSSFGGVIGLRVIDRIGKGFRESPRDALISLSTPQEELGRSFGYHRALDTIGAILGPLAAYFILKAYPSGFNIVFVTSFAMGLLALFSLSLVKDIQTIVESKKSFESPNAFGFGFKIYLLAVFILSVGTLPVAILLFKTADIGLLIASIPLFYMVYNLSYAIFSYPAGRVSDAIGPIGVIVTGYLFLIVGYVVLAHSSTAVLLFVGFLLIGVFSALTDGVQRSYLSNFIDSKYKATAYGYYNAAVGFGALISGVVGGYLWQKAGDVNALYIALGVIVFGLLILLLGISSKMKSS